MKSDPIALDLFDQPVPVRSRHGDPDTSRAAAAVVARSLNEIQRAVLQAFRELGPISARQAEQLPRFAQYGFSTVRKRTSELHQLGLLTSCGVEQASGKTPATTYRTTSSAIVDG